MSFACVTPMEADRIFKSGAYGLKFLPSEAYVFTQTDCAQLMGWRNGYSGTAGYFIQYGPWRQPIQWKERWGQTEQIFGLTPELIDRSCLPHCKLDVYMEHHPGMRHYPVPYLRLYQHHPNAESVLVHGLPCVLGDLISSKTEASDWKNNKQGRMDLFHIDWTQTRPAQMLRLTKEELRIAKAQGWGIRYLLHQCKVLASEGSRGFAFSSAGPPSEQISIVLISRGGSLPTVRVTSSTAI